MIASLYGTIIHRDLSWLILEAAGVGYQVLVPSHLVAPLGADMRLYTSHQIREDSMHLYGFATLAERAFFELLLSVSGIGPKGALAIMGIGSIDRISGAILKGDPTLFESVSGIGKKAAAKIIVELKNKVGNAADGYLPIDADSHTDLVVALEGLGYRRQEILILLPEMPADMTDVEAQLRWALKQLVSRK